MLNVSAAIVCRLVELAREFHAQEAVTFPEELENDSGDWAVQMLASHSGDTTFQEFKSIIEDLEPDQQQEVVGLLWVGRGDYSVDEWDEVLEITRDEWTTHTAEYLIAHPLLPDDLQEGLAAFGLSCE